jgi:hypothetical protein
MNGPYCEILLKRAKDLNDKDVVRLNGPIKERCGWREVLAVYRNLEDLEADYDIDLRTYNPELAKDAADALDRSASEYVIVRLLRHETSRDEVEDFCVKLYAFDLVEVQSLPAWEEAAPETRRTPGAVSALRTLLGAGPRPGVALGRTA